MRPSGPISLFHERSQSSPPTTSFFLSVLVHGVVIGLVAAVIFMRPKIIVEPFPEQLALRHIDLHMPDPPIARPKNLGIKYPGPKPLENKPLARALPSAKPAVARQVAQMKPAPQTLLQPKLPKMVLPEKLPLPTVVLWKMDSKQPRVIIPPQPNKPVVSLAQPSVAPPNNEANLDKIPVASSPLPSKVQPILPSTTSPMVVLAPQQAPQAPPQTTSKSTAEPTPAAVVSLSDLRKEGDVALPPANQTASGNSSALLAPGRPEDQAQADHGGNAPGDSAAGNKPEAGGGGKADTSKGGGGKQELAVGQAAVSDSGATSSVEKIALPKDGQFAAVIVGSTLEEAYPEAAELWAGRLAYTVYLHVGLTKSWILQYSLPPSADAANGGNAAHLAAPWPYTIIRPNLTLGDLNADALMIHGLVNAAGHFEALAVAFPPRFSQAEFVLSSLKQWEFRPASQGGKATAVEVLLIIPEESE